MVRMSKRPRKSLTEMTRSIMVRYMSAEVPLYQGNMGRKSGCSWLVPSCSDLQQAGMCQTGMCLGNPLSQNFAAGRHVGAAPGDPQQKVGLLLAGDPAAQQAT